MTRTRLAPSPTGALHLGNARTFLINWTLARQNGWQIVLRIDDLDGPRVKPGADQQAIDILRWLGIDWDEGPYYQRHDLSRYQAALRQLADDGLIYPCRCTRSQIQAASLSAPHAGDHELRYPGTCRPATSDAVDVGLLGKLEVAWRVKTTDEPIGFTDQYAGEHQNNVHREVGDFLVSTKTGLPSYQLSAVIDDHDQCIDQIVRGDDLLGSTARQLHLYRLLDLSPLPAYTHLPLVIGSDGRRLAKRHGDTRIDYYREKGVTAERIIGLLAEWSGLGERREMETQEFLQRFDLSKLPRQPIVFEQSDDHWLVQTNK